MPFDALARLTNSLALEAIDELTTGRALLENPDHWCKTEIGVDAHGLEINPWEDNCLRRCVVGAMHGPGRLGKKVNSIAVTALNTAATARGFPDGAHVFNDDTRTTHDDVLALFDEAIAWVRLSHR